MTGGYGKGPDIINSCSVNVERGEIVSILGPNGAGKSTAMKAMLGLLNLKSGSVVINGKMRRTGICGATETLLVNEHIAKKFLPKICSELNEKGCEIVGDEVTKSIVPYIDLAIEEDWSTEYLAPKISIKVVGDVYDAIEHIQKFGTQHTDAIMTENEEIAKVFTNAVDSAIVLVNASTQFADGGEFGLGAEIGISTGKLHARGPVGAAQLTSFKYVVHGNGKIRP